MWGPAGGNSSDAKGRCREIGVKAAARRPARRNRPSACDPPPTVSFPGAMGISQPQNLRIPPIEKLRPYGVRVSLPPGDPFRKLLGPEWHRVHWYPTPEERDAALAEMSRRHQYSRATDKPSLLFQKVEKLAESRGL